MGSGLLGGLAGAGLGYYGQQYLPQLFGKPEERGLDWLKRHQAPGAQVPPAGAQAPPPAQHQQAPPPQPYRDPRGQPVYYQQQAYAPPPQQSANQKILRQGLLGAGTGAIAAGASGGKAGTGALIGAGTNIIGGALLDSLMAPSQSRQPQPYYQQPPPQPYYQQQAPPPQKKIIRKYDANGNIISEEEIYE